MNELAIIVFITIAIVMILNLFFGSGQEEDIRINVEGSNAQLRLGDINQINRIILLRSTFPKLMLRLAKNLEGDAWQMAQTYLFSTLWRLGEEDQALNLLTYLDSHHRASAIEIFFSELVEADNAALAVQFLKQTGEQPPENSWIRTHLLSAENKQDEARSLLEEISQGNIQLSDSQWLQLARLQRSLGDTVKARESLEQFWALQHEKNAEDIPFVNQFIRELAYLGDVDRLSEIVNSTEIGYSNPFISPLLESGLLTQALQQIQRTPSLSQSRYHQEYVETLLEQGKQSLAEEFIADLDEYESTYALKHLIHWKFEHDLFEEALRDIQRLSRDQTKTTDTYLSLIDQYGQSQPNLTRRMLDQAEKWIDSESKDEVRENLRLTALQLRLNRQIQLPEHERSQYEISRSLKELLEIQKRLPPYQKILSTPQNASLLHALGKKNDALQLIEEALNYLKEGLIDKDTDDEDVISMRVDLAITLLHMGHTKQAITTYRSANDVKSIYSGQWFEALIENNQLTYIVSQLDYALLISILPNAGTLLSKLEQPENKKLYAHLIEKMSQDDFWETKETTNPGFSLDHPSESSRSQDDSIDSSIPLDAPTTGIAITADAQIKETTISPEVLLQRIKSLKHMPDIALELCKRLPEESTLDLRIEIGTDLFLQQRGIQDLALLNELSPEDRKQSLKKAISLLVASGRYDDALTLIAKTESPLPTHKIHQGLLLAHQGSNSEAQQVLDQLVEELSAREPEKRLIIEALKIAEIALIIGHLHTVSSLILLVWNDIENSITEQAYLLEWLIPLLLKLDERNKIRALAALLSPQETAEFILPAVFKQDQYLGNQLVRSYCQCQSTEDYDYVLTALLNSGQLRQAEDLLRSIQTEQILILALRYALSLASNDNWQQVRPNIERLVPSVLDRLTIYAELSIHYQSTQPVGLLELLDHAEAIARNLPETDPKRSNILLDILNDQIARKDENGLALRAQRLEEIQALINNEKDPLLKFNNLLQLANTLLESKATAELLTALSAAEAAHQQLPHPDKNDPYAGMPELDRLAAAYLQAGEVDKALKLKEQINCDDFNSLPKWATLLSQHGRFEEAISALRKELLNFSGNPIEQVYHTFICHQQGSPYKDQLLDKITSNPFWDPWSSGILRPLVMNDNFILPSVE